MKSNLSILLVEDDPNLGFLLQESLEKNGYCTRLCTDGETAWKLVKETSFTLCLIDIMLPKKDGFTLAKEIRQVHPQMPLMFVTAKSLKSDLIQGFKLGADDYITKPFSMEELLWRIKAVLKRSHGIAMDEEQDVISIGEYQFHPKHKQLIWKDKEIHLTDKESDLLLMLAKQRNNVLERKIALETIWQEHTFFTARSMDVYISRLRKYLNNDPRIKLNNVHGKGFKLIISDQ